MEEDTTKEPLADGDNVAPADGEKAVNTESKESIKDILSKELGKEFPTDEAALKSVKDTFSYVGKKKEDIKEEVKKEEPQTDDFVSRKEFEEATFYAKHPEYEPYKGIIGALKSATDNPLEEVVKADDFKAVYEKAVAHDESEKSKSVLQTNPRLGKVTDKMTQAKEAADKGDTTAAKNLAVAGVIEAYES